MPYSHLPVDWNPTKAYVYCCARHIAPRLGKRRPGHKSHAELVKLVREWSFVHEVPTRAELLHIMLNEEDFNTMPQLAVYFILEVLRQELPDLKFNKNEPLAELKAKTVEGLQKVGLKPSYSMYTALAVYRHEQKEREARFLRLAAIRERARDQALQQ